MIRLSDICAGYPGKPVLRDIFIQFPAGQLTSLLGHSGCGKTTLLKVIAGLLTPTSGSLLINGEPADHLPADKRQAAMVFQKPLLFPHMSVQENVAFGLRVRRLNPDETKRRVSEMLELLQIGELATRRPSQLSGGQEQRVSLARALVTNPKVLLLDEPFSALDESLREEMRTLLRKVQRELRITTVFVTHDQEEAAQLSDQIVLLLDGTVAQQGTPQELFSRPRTSQVAAFLGWKVLPGRPVGAGFETAAGTFVMPTGGRPTHMAFRPEKLQLTSDGLPGTIEEIVHWGRGRRLRVMLHAGVPLLVELPGFTEDFKVGDPVCVKIPVEEICWFAENWC